MASSGTSGTIFDSAGPLVDEGAPYCGMGIVELIALYKYLLPSWDCSLKPIPSQITETPYWQYGLGSHASSRRRIMGSVLIYAESDQEVPLQIGYLVIEGSPQWAIGRNDTRFCNIPHVTRHCLIFRSALDNELLSMYLLDAGGHCYLPFSVLETTYSGRVENARFLFPVLCKSLIYCGVTVRELQTICADTFAGSNHIKTSNCCFQETCFAMNSVRNIYLTFWKLISNALLSKYLSVLERYH